MLRNLRRPAGIFNCARNGGKIHEFGVYLDRDLFDTPENRVIPSGLTFGLGITGFWVVQPIKDG